MASVQNCSLLQKDNSRPTGFGALRLLRAAHLREGDYRPRPHQLIHRCPCQKQKPGGDHDSNIGDEPNQNRMQHVAGLNTGICTKGYASFRDNAKVSQPSLCCSVPSRPASSPGGLPTKAETLPPGRHYLGQWRCGDWPFHRGGGDASIRKAISASGALNRPRRNSGGSTASTASSFSVASIRR